MPRADDLATRYFFHPLKALFPPGSRLPILMYHSISNREERAHPYYRTVTSPEVFAQHMHHLHENGYSTPGLQEAVGWLDAPRNGQGRPVVITFDDGFQDFYTNAFPILSRYGLGATMFLPTAYIGKTARTFKGADCMTWGQVRELREAGVEFGSHTVTHPQLKTLKDEEVQREIQQSREDIEQELGGAVTSFAYPYAFPETDRAFTARLRGHLQQSGYQTGVSTSIGRASQTDDKFFMRRLPVNSCDDSRLFAAKLDGGYDWLHAVQYASKLISGRK
jgi:peptidoglycan/xylan/chitin deacetylase (PgdA/CDA1 family)